MWSSSIPGEKKEMGFDKHMALSATVKNKLQIVLLLKFNDM